MFISTLRKVLTDLLYKHESFKKDNLTIIDFLNSVISDLNTSENEEVPLVVIEIINQGGYEDRVIYKSKDVRLVIVNNILGQVRTLDGKEIKSLETKKAEK